MSRYPLCSQDHCVLHDPAAGPDLVVELALAALTGRELQEVVGERDPIAPRKRCLDCLQRVMRGGRPFVTAKQHAQDVRAGKTSHRRERRHRNR